jgi:hypothetical protein
VKVLVSVNRPVREDDFCWVPDGEIVYEQALTCSSYERAMLCGCGRSLAGTTTHKSTSTMEVAEVEVSDDDMVALALKVGKETGWGSRYVLYGLDEMRKAADRFPVGTQVEARISAMHPDTFVYEAVVR